MIERLTPRERRVDANLQGVFDFLLPDKLRQPLRSERQLDGTFFRELLRCRDLGPSHALEYKPKSLAEADGASDGDARNIVQDIGESRARVPP